MMGTGFLEVLGRNRRGRRPRASRPASRPGTSNRVTGNRGWACHPRRLGEDLVVLEGLTDGLLQRGPSQVLRQDATVGADQERRREYAKLEARADAGTEAAGESLRPAQSFLLDRTARPARRSGRTTG